MDVAFITFLVIQQALNFWSACEVIFRKKNNCKVDETGK